MRRDHRSQRDVLQVPELRELDGVQLKSVMRPEILSPVHGAGLKDSGPQDWPLGLSHHCGAACRRNHGERKEPPPPGLQDEGPSRDGIGRAWSLGPGPWSERAADPRPPHRFFLMTDRRNEDAG